MRVLQSFVTGWILGFASTLLFIVAACLGTIGVVTAILARSRPWWITNFNLDPSDLVARAAVIGVVAILLAIAAVAHYRHLSKAARRSPLTPAGMPPRGRASTDAHHRA
ncbi:MAG TPA: hypothetical protein VIL01_14225 [Thermomicrobiales bacterium]